MTIEDARDKWLALTAEAVAIAQKNITKKGDFIIPLEKPWPEWEEARMKADEAWLEWQRIIKQKEKEMRIKEIIAQSRRDFTAIYECEHCKETSKDYGYDDSNFHVNVIPNMDCKSCGKKANDNDRPLATKYPDEMVI